MSRFFTTRYANLVPYVPGEQPRDRKYIKLNTNESPFPPSPSVAEAVGKESALLPLYCDPECTLLREAMSKRFGVSPDRILMTNGSDEGLNFAFMAFADETRPLIFPDITYGFYPVFAQLNHIPYEEVPLSDDFSIVPEAYLNCGKTVVIANPNAPTGKMLPLSVIEEIVKSNPESVVIVDEAYVDFGGESAIPLTGKYDNLLVVGTFSKSRSMAGARLGYCIASPALIADLNTIKYSTNPYNVNRLTQSAGIAALNEDGYYMENCKKIIATRERLTRELISLGFTVLPSKTNFVFAKSDKIGGKELYEELRARGILIRHFTLPRIADYNRITIGTDLQTDCLLKEIRTILEEIK